ncbi:hypothetical protein FKL27_25695 [Klebsiella pneumoniae]|uniref:Uncharacterized protein n=1 Tax=Klebsiella quasipneumoniae TaxID=1463165 RepID=A0A483K656_9ENTR|nr:hypothetical protein DLJ83_27610 [Klebsiella pneumoniae]KAA6496537.1 hypothetical protein EHW95_03730 [Klebsiella quasipneumoniae]OYE74407.1 hypothetical protein CI627_10360 [Klebsiella pneumoniae subsp. pneumoniae]TPE02995.1 hypothetical protein FJP66_23685 [Klebsiella variicola]AZH52400.1 hypothetical protein CRT36_27040 [Klebsiella pneumoniae]
MSCRGRGFDVLRGPAEPAPGYNLHPFESRSPQGQRRHGLTHLSGAGHKSFCGSMQKVLWTVHYTLDSQCDRLWLCQPGRMDSNG